jgi:two-component system CheB/CheR fusion protein
MANTPIPGERAQEGAAPRSLRVLVADDDRDFTLSLTKLLSVAGYDARGVNSPLQVQEAMLDFAPDVVLLDISMPGRSGFDVAHELRNLYGRARPVLIAVTGRTMERDRRVARMAGIDHYVTKPYDPDALLDLLQSIASGRSAPEL